MVIDMNETQVRTLEQVRQVLEGTQALQLHPQETRERNEWIAQVLQRLGYPPSACGHT
jgi:DNA-binding GntR family transcriptional regulator